MSNSNKDMHAHLKQQLIVKLYNSLISVEFLFTILLFWTADGEINIFAHCNAVKYSS
jgi:hypothetical protein